MDADSSLLLYLEYSKSPNQKIRLTLKNEQQITGYIVGFYKGDENSADSYIIEWRIAEKTQKKQLFHSSVTPEPEITVLHKNIKEVLFFDTNEVIQV